MGQAFDRDGNLLGEAEGATKREVFDKLNAEFKQAHEIRIKSMDEKIAVGSERRDPVVGAKDRMLQFFQYAHLPPHLQAISKPYCEMAERIVNEYPMNPERTVCLRKLLECKDAAVRTFLYKEI